MNDSMEIHEPTPQFRAALERDMIGAFRRGTQFAPPGSRRSGRLGRVFALVACAVLTLAIGLAFGTSTGYASGRIEGDRQRSEMAASTIEVTGQLTALRADLARTRADLARRAAERGAVPQASLLAAESELRAMEASAGRIELDLTQSREVTAPSQPALIRSIPMKRALAITCSALAIGAQAGPAQQGVPIVDLPSASVRSPETFGTVLGVRQLPGGRLLVNDGRRHLVKLLDSTLATGTVVIDSEPGNANSYGPYGTALIPYRGDSSLFSHFDSQTLLVLDGVGRIARVSALPEPTARNSLIGVKSSGAGIDDKGRLLYKNSPPTYMLLGDADPATGASRSHVTQPGDSLEIFRADLDARRIDTVGRVMQAWSGGRISVVFGTNGARDRLKVTMNPLTSVDEWAVLSDGTIAFVRGQDYHIDWIHPDGSRSSTGKLPFDWKRLTDDDKQKLLDSARTAQEAVAAKQLANEVKSRLTEIGTPDAGGGMTGRSGQRGDGAGRGGGGGRGMLVDFAPLKEIADYYPAIRPGAAIADLDGNLWILPTASAQSKNGELVYDVVNPRKGLFERVRAPEGRSIAGFGKGGIVYLVSGDRTNGFYLERTKLGTIGGKAPAK
jgi:hypothetical protein